MSEWADSDVERAIDVEIPPWEGERTPDAEWVYPSREKVAIKFPVGRRKPGKKVKSSGLKCPECGSAMVRRIQRSTGDPFWGCSAFPNCRATHGAHPDGRPLGRPGTKEEKRKRIEAHDWFDRLWKTGIMSRPKAYQWMQTALVMTPKQAHIGLFGVAECDALIAVVKAFLEGTKCQS